MKYLKKLHNYRRIRNDIPLHRYVIDMSKVLNYKQIFINSKKNHNKTYQKYYTER